MEELRCIGCGSIIQSDDQTNAGYVPASKLNEPSEDLVCRRCFRLTHYNEVTPLSITKDDFYRVVSEIGQTNSLVVNIVDVFDLEGSIIPQISRLTNHNELIIIANKRDLLPKAVSDQKLLHHIRKIVSDHDLKPLKIMIMSAKKNQNLDQVMDTIIDLSNQRDIYVVGATNVGKSTFINAVLKAYADSSKDVITVSATAGTTLDMIKIPLDNQYLIDTPGIINEVQMTHYIDQESLKVITPKKEIKPKVYQLNPGQTLFMNGFARVDFIGGEKTSFVCYVGEFVTIHRTKLENADAFYEKHRYGLLAPPSEETSYELKEHRFHMKKKQDIVLPGLGFVTVLGDVDVAVSVHRETTPYVRGALI